MSKKQPGYPSLQAVRRRAKELRWQMTPAEKKLWAQLSNKQLHGLKFRRQHPLHHFILDFYCRTQRLVVEVDGGAHSTQRDYDEAREEWLIQRGSSHISLPFCSPASSSTHWGTPANASMRMVLVV
ncbi:MAG TPA: endonuclease domain-containing protein [Chloroflexi bacterium]|nr:endonuclease domain-containing protein [Chloroflexota bacterium]